MTESVLYTTMFGVRRHFMERVIRIDDLVDFVSLPDNIVQRINLWSRAGHGGKQQKTQLKTATLESAD